MKVAVIGLGIMGGAYARNLHAAGETVIGVDPAPAARAALASEGITVHEAPGPWIAACDLVILSLVSPGVLAAVCAELRDDAETGADRA